MVRDYAVQPGHPEPRGTAVADTPADPRLAAPRLGKAHRLEERLAEGSLGVVWRGVDTRSGETVAVRVLPPDTVADRQELRRVLRPGSPVRTLRDPHVVAVRDYVEERRRVALVTDFLDAGDLRTILRSEGPLAPRVAVALASNVLAGLAAFHAAGLVHGDVRPENVMLPSYWRRLSPGSARLTDAVLPGLADRPVGTAEDDVYAAGAVLHEMLTGRAPVAGQPVGTLDLPPRLWNALASLLAVDPALRPTAAHGARTLADLVDTLGALRPLAPTRSGRPGRPAASRVGAARYLPTSDLTGPAPRLGEPAEHTVARSSLEVPAERLPVEAPPVRTPWYRRAWVWAAVGGTLLVAAAATWVVLGRPGLPG